MDINQNVRNFRLAAGITCAEPARRAGVAQSTIRNMENGTTQPNLTTLAKLAAALHKSLIEFIP